MSRLTPSQFEALAALATVRSAAAQEAARLVMVEGLRNTDAAVRAGVSEQSAANAVSRLTRRLELCRIAAGV